MSDTKDLIAVQEGQIISEDPITLNPLDLDKADTWEDFVCLWNISQEIDVRNQWFKGDIANKVEVIYGEKSLDKFSEDVHEKRVTVEGFRRVARAFPRDTRNPILSWTHYFLASFTDSFKKGEGKFEGNERFKWIGRAADESWSTTRLAEEIKKEQALTEGKQSIFDYYDSYLDKVSYVLLHIEKSNLTKEEAERLLDKLMAIHDELTVYLDNVSKS